MIKFLNHNYFRQILAVILVFLAGGICSSAATYTVNFYHGKSLSGEQDYYLTVKAADQTAIVDHQRMSLAGCVTIKGVAHPYFSYTFESEATPETAAFSAIIDGSNINSNPQDFVDGRLYDGSGTSTLHISEVTVSEAEKQTLLIADKAGWGNTDKGIMIHAWSNTTGGLTEWANNKKATDTGQYYLDEDTYYYPVYKYEYVYTGDLDEMILRNGNKTTVAGEFQTDKLAILYDGESTGFNFIDMPSILYDEEIKSTFIVYFADTQGWGAENTKVHCWGKKGQLNDWYSNESMVDTGLCIKVGDSEDYYYPLYKYEFQYAGLPEGIVFHKNNEANTVDLVFHNEMVYVKGGSAEASQVGNYADLDKVSADDVNNYTVYFANSCLWDSSDIKVHIWNSGSSYVLTEWIDDPVANDTGKYVVIDGNAYKLFSISFKWNYPGRPDSIIWHNSKEKTADAEYIDNKIYLFTGHPLYPGICDLGQQYTLDEVWPDYHKTYYYADSDLWGVESTAVHLWNKYGSASEWTDDLRPVDTGRWIKVNDLWCQLYKVETLFNAEGLNIHHPVTYRETGNHVAIPDKVYYYAGPSMIEDPIDLPEDLPAQRPTDLPAEPRYIYVNLGANQMYRSNLWKEPHAKFLLRQPDQYATKEFYESILPHPYEESEVEEYNSQKMEYVRDGFYRILCDDINKYSEVVFYYTLDYRDHNDKYYDALAFPITFGSNLGNDPTTWATYVFDIGLDCMHQSYLTEETYLNVWEENPSVLYFMGNNAFYDEADANPHNLDILRGLRIEKDEDVYIVPMGTIKDDQTIFFKISMFDCKEIMDKEGKVDGKNYFYQRGYATVNPGTIGMAFPGDEMSGPWYNDHIVDTDERGGSRMTRAYVNETYRINNYCQYPWRIDEGEGGVKENQEYFLVIDLHSDNTNHNSLTLIEFDPTPTLEVKSGKIEKKPLSLADAQELHAPDLLSGCNDNGYIYFDYVNEYSISAKLNEVGSWLLEDSETEVDEDGDGNISESEKQTTPAPYSVEYYVFLEYDDLKIPVSKFGRPSKEADGMIDISNLVYSDDAHYYIRAVYYDKINDRHFCSHYVKVEPQAVLADLKAPSTQEVTGQLIIYLDQNDPNLKPTVGGAFTLPFSQILTDDGNEIPYAYFPDYMMGDIMVNDSNVASTSSLIHANHHAAEKHENFLGMLLQNQGMQAWTPYTDEAEEYQEHHNWANYIAREKQLPLFIDNLATPDAGSTRIDATADITLSAVYPFMIHQVETDITSVNMPRRATRLSDGRAILPIAKSTTALAKFGEEVIVSGIENPVQDEITSGSDTEYFTISGQRLSAAPTAPGIYIRRCGQQVEKIQVR